MNRHSNTVNISAAIGTAVGTFVGKILSIFIAGAVFNIAADILCEKFGIPIPDLTYWNWCIMYWAARILFRNVLWGGKNG